LGLVTWLALRPPGTINAIHLLVITLVLTLGATGLTLFLLNQLMAPIQLTYQALRHYLTQQQLPNLPTEYGDEVGILMRDIHHSLHELDHLLQEKKDLMYLFSHNLRSPGITVLSLIHLLQNRLSQERSREREFAQQIERTIHGQLNTMDSLLALLRLGEMRDQKLPVHALALHPLITEVVSDLQPQWNSKQLQVQVDLAPDLNVLSHSAILTQIIQNLLQNAIKFSPRGSTIQIQANVHQKHVHLTISDQGLGFAPDLAEALFAKFTPHGRKGTAEEKSNGIGLYLCRQLVEKIQGRIWASSPGDGQGATFSLDLPAAQPQTVARPDLATEQSA
jgi:signal transduction histidine kinase